MKTILNPMSWRTSIIGVCALLSAVWIARCGLSAQAESPSFPKPTFVLKHTVGVSSIAFSHDGKTLATAYGNEEKKGGLSLWNISSGKLVAELIKGKTVDQVSFAGDGDNLICLSEGKQKNDIQIWNVKRQRVSQSLPNPKRVSIHCFAVTPSGSLIGLGGGNFEDDQPAHVTLWNPKRNKYKTIADYEYAAAIITLCFSPNGLLIAGNGTDWDLGYSQIQIYDLKTNRRIVNIKQAEELSITKLAFSPDNDVLAVIGDSFVGLRNREGVLRYRLPIEGHGNSLAFSPDGKYIVASYLTEIDQGMIKIWLASTRKLLLTRNLNSGTVNDLAFSPDGSLLATACKNGSVQVWKFRDFIAPTQKAQGQ